MVRHGDSMSFEKHFEKQSEDIRHLFHLFKKRDINSVVKKDPELAKTYREEILEHLVRMMDDQDEIMKREITIDDILFVMKGKM